MGSKFIHFDTKEEATRFFRRSLKPDMSNTPSKPPPIPTEHEEQKNLIYWCEIMKNRYPELKLIFAIPNGGDRNEIVAAKLKAEGVKSGVPDLCLPVPRTGYHGLYIEMKRLKGTKTSINQNRWIKELRNQGYCVKVCNGFEAAKDVITWYLNINLL